MLSRKFYYIKAVKKMKNPSDFLTKIIGQNVRVKLTSGVEYTGILRCLDGYMNVVMAEAEEFSHGIKTASYKDVFLRGNNVLYIRD